VTTRPELNLGGHLLPGLAAVALFALLAYVFLTASVGASAGFPASAPVENVSVTDNASANVTLDRSEAGVRAVAVANGSETANLTVTDDPEANVTLVTAGGSVFATVNEPVSITENVGYAMFDLLDQGTVPSEGFLVAFEVIDLVLVAALAAAVMLARRDDTERVRTALASDDDGGED
jgi:methionine-rich copper-binding protein CopC